MNQAQAQRNLRNIEDVDERYREWKIQKVQTTFELDRNTAAQTLEWIELKFANQTFAAACGIVAGVYVHKKLTPILQGRNLIFKKPWMRPIVPLMAGYAGYHGAKQLRGRRFAGREATFEKMSGSNDVISRFRHIDDNRTSNSSSADLASYLNTSAHTSRSQVESGVINTLTLNDPRYKDRRIKRLDKDTDDIYWLMGRIHGLENIAFVDDEKLLATKGDPVALQVLVNDSKAPGIPATTYDGLVAEYMNKLNDYKTQVDHMALSRSDRSKFLALPFFASRKTEGPAPKEGQWQYNLFTELAGGKEWDHYDHLEVDPEKKITLYDYEKHLPASYLKNVDTNSEEFKREVKLMTLLSKTQFERHQKIKSEFREMMNVLSLLNEEEGKAFVHLLKNKHRDNYLEDLHGGHVEAELAKISERENYLKKDRYILEQKKLQFRDKDRLAVDKAKVKDLFRHAQEFKKRFNSEFGLYDMLERNIDLSKKVVQGFMRTASHGSLKKLKEEVGLDDKYPTNFLRIKDIKEVKEGWCDDAVMDHSMYYALSAYFLPINMTDYEEEFLALGDYDNDELKDVGTRTEDYFIRNVINGKDPSKIGVEWDDARKPNFFLTTSEEENAPIPDDDEEGEGEEEEVPDTYWTAREFELAPAEPEEEPDWPYPERKFPVQDEAGFFDVHEKLTDKFDEIELDTFMKFLNVKPFRNWEDKAGYHNRLGVRTPEDFSQRVDPEYHMLAEVEREEFERKIFSNHRMGSTVRFTVGNKKPHFGGGID